MNRANIFFLLLKTLQTTLLLYILFPAPVFSWLKKKRNRVIRHRSRWKMTKETSFRRGWRTDGDKEPPSPLHPFSLRKSKGRVIARLIPQDKSLSDSRNPRQLDREIRFYPFYFPVCFGERGERGRLISRIENEKKGKEERDFGKKKRKEIWISLQYTSERK